MLCLGIESTAHTIGIGIVDDKGNILANERSTLTTESGGIHPRKAVEHHHLFFGLLLEKVFDTAKVKPSDIDLIAFSKGPGLGGTLRVSAAAARALATKLNISLIGVNHPVAHIEIAKLTSGFKDPVILYVSGANTQIISLAAGKYRVVGETLDMGVGNFLDAFGRSLGLGFPQGPKIEELARKSKTLIELPYTIKGMDFSFSGILTKLERMKNKPEDLCYSAQETVFAILTEASERALAHLNKKEFLVTGGVAANKRLGEMLNTMCKARGIRFHQVPKELSGDQGAMIAWLGILEYKSGRKQTLKQTEVDKNWRTDEVDVIWT
ncbi:MAG: bifunctional N(6)-L-threonylcarbamoyladenine synthase/serine/threonine protein kinase [DPANN group archaeon]|nr:bifunctional N(6)-L-threonylcarbamoyladenine synthase/serine/threonine protein kinase [DPANN group archaeon]